MAFHTTTINGMGAVTQVGATFATTGMQAQDHMHISEDFIAYPGVVNSLDLQVVQNGSPNMTINVSAGRCYVLNTNYAVNSVSQNKFWRLINDAAFNIAITSNGTGNPRITSIFAKINVSVTPDGTATNTATCVAVDGTAAASPVAPAAPSDGNSYYRLADITVASGATSIVTANILDQRLLVALISLNTPDSVATNYKLSATVASNNLTLAIKTLDGNDPTTANPVTVRINNITRKITAALSLTVNAGVNTMNLGAAELATQDTDLFAYLGYRVSDSSIFIGASRMSHGRVYSDFNATATNEKYLTFSGSAPASTDSVVNIGRFNASLSASASFNWSIPATAIIENRPIYETRFMTWAPTYTASGSMTYGTITTAVAKYKVVRDEFEFELDATGTTGGTASNTLQATLPFTSLNDTAGRAFSGLTVDAATNAGIAINSANSNTIGIRKYDSSNYALASGKIIRITGARMRLV